MPILRDLVSRITFRTDTTELREMDKKLLIVKRGIAAIAATALSGWAIKAGGDIASLELQLKTLSQGGLKPIQDAIDDLASNTGADAGLASIFSREDLIRASIALEQLGFRGKETGEKLQQAAILSARANKPIQEIAQMLGQAITEGGLPDFFRQLGFTSREAAEDIAIMEAKLGEAAGVLAPRVMRQMREQLAGDFFRNLRPKLEAELKELQEGPAGVTRRLGSQMESLWNRIARAILDVMTPALDAVSNITREVTQLFRQWGLEIDNNKGLINALFDAMDKGFPNVRNSINSVMDILGENAAGLIAGGTVGGLLVFLATGNPFFLLAGVLGGAAAGMKVQAELEKFFKQREETGEKRAPVERDLGVQEIFPGEPLPSSPESGAVSSVPDRTDRTLAAATTSAGGRGAGGGVDVRVFLTVNTQAADADAVGRVVEDRLTTMMRRVTQDLLPLTEGVA